MSPRRKKSQAEVIHDFIKMRHDEVREPGPIWIAFEPELWQVVIDCLAASLSPRQSVERRSLHSGQFETGPSGQAAAEG